MPRPKASKLTGPARQAVQQIVRSAVAAVPTGGGGGGSAAWGSITGVLAAQSDLNTALAGKAPTVHTHAQADVTGLVAALAGKEPANANIQAHIASAHAPANAQKNSDITKAEIEAKLTGVIASHSHPGGSANAVEASVDFGGAGSPIQTVTVAAAWVGAGSIIVATPFATPADGQTLENYFVANFYCVVSNRVAGASFDLTVLNPTGAAGIYRFHCIGV